MARRYNGKEEVMRKIVLGMVVVCFVMMTTAAYGVSADPGLDKKGGGEVVVLSTILCKFDKGANWAAPFLSELISN